MVILLIVIVFLRFLGLMVLAPSLREYAATLTDAPASVIGLGLGLYGLLQAVLQRAWGSLSDRWGRKWVLLLGLGLATVGSGLAVCWPTFGGLVLARGLQGAAAIGGVLLAFLADLTGASDRRWAMAGFGISMGLGFLLAIGLGPLLAFQWTMRGLFGGVTLLMGASFGLACLLPTHPGHRALEAASVDGSDVQRLILWSSLGVGLLHASLMILFFQWPLHWPPLLLDAGFVYRWTLGGVVVLAGLGALWFFKKSLFFQIKWATFLLALGLGVGVNLETAPPLFLAGLFCFFWGFMGLEAALPAFMADRIESGRGRAMGTYGSSQFLGVFVGSLFAGCWEQGRLPLWGLRVILGLAALVWLLCFSTAGRILERGESYVSRD